MNQNKALWKSGNGIGLIFNPKNSYRLYPDFRLVKFTLISILFLLLLTPNIKSQSALDNACHNIDFKSIQVYPEGNPTGYPLIGLRSGEKLEFHFDEMSTEFESYNFGVIHCSHDWQPSDLEASEYLQGFQTQQISQFDASFSTRFNYVHYRFHYPSDMSQPRYSGNYLLAVFTGSDINDHSSWIISCRFIIYEQAVSVLSRVGRSSVIKDRFKKQEVDFDIGHKDFTIYDPMRDIHVTILQNMDWTHAITGLKPIFITPETLTFDYSNGENTFDGGNEYRSLDTKNLSYVSSETESMALEGDGYHIYLRPDPSEGKKAYASWSDLNGSWIVRNDQASDSHLEAEYIWVHFKLNMPEISEAQIFLDGKFDMYNQKRTECFYDKTSQSYQCKLLLKQGYYNYRYILRDKYESTDNIQITEGSHSETENDYHIVVYMYDRNLDCDRVIAIKADNSVR